MPPRSKQVPTAQPARLPSYAMAASRTALSLIISEASTAEDEDEEGDATSSSVDNRNFEAVEQSASEVLLDVFTRYMRSLGTAARNAAQHAGRSESNLMDMLQALHHSGGRGCTAGDLLAFVNKAPEVAFPCNLSAAFPVPREPLSTSVAASTTAGPESRPPYVPDFLPAFPEKRTYSHTATYNCRVNDAPAAKKRRSKHQRQAQESLFALAEAGASDATASGALATTSSSSAPPPPLPSLTHTDEAVDVDAMNETGSGGHRQGALALASVPDVLAPSFPAVLQSSARLESSGVAAASFGLPAAHGTSAREAEAAQQAAAAAIAAATPRQAAVLSLEHRNRLEEIKEERGGGAAAANGAEE